MARIGGSITATAPQVERAARPRREFTQRELEVIRYLPTRLSNAEIGGRLQISQSTVKTHLKKIYLKLGVGCRNDAILVATGWRLIPIDLAAGLEQGPCPR